MIYIACSTPYDETDACKIHAWKNSELEVDGNENKLFISFKRKCLLKYNPAISSNPFVRFAMPLLA
jgi:hypothetical protein